MIRTTIALDYELLAKAEATPGLKAKSGLVREEFKALVERESARRLARLGGRPPRLKATPNATTAGGTILVDTSV